MGFTRPGKHTKNYGKSQFLLRNSTINGISMGDLQDPKRWRYVNVPFFRPYWGYSLKLA